MADRSMSESNLAFMMMGYVTWRQLESTIIITASISLLVCLQVQPACVQLIMPQGDLSLQDFTAGQEASIKQYGLDGAAAAQGLQVQLQLEEGAARVQALIQQEVHLVKQELLSARLRSPAARHATGTGTLPDHACPAILAALSSASLQLSLPGWEGLLLYDVVWQLVQANCACKGCPCCALVDITCLSCWTASLQVWLRVPQQGHL